jgi:hypothetical protein
VQLLIAVLLLTLSATAQPARTALRGTWTATVGANRMVQGVWSAQIASSAPNSVSGSWAVLNDARQIVLQGTWSAVKVEQRLNGTWSARVVQGGRGLPARPGQPMSGNWSLDAATVTAKTLDELFQRALETTISGAWATAGLRGRWSAKRTE